MQINETTYKEFTVNAFGIRWIFNSDEIPFKTKLNNVEEREIQTPTKEEIKNMINNLISHINLGWGCEEGNLLFYKTFNENLCQFKFAVEITSDLKNLFEKYKNSGNCKDIMHHLWENEQNLSFS